MAGKGAPLTRRLELRALQPQMLICHSVSGATRDHEPVGAANRALRAIALGAAALRPKASAVPHVVTLVAIRSPGLRESRRAPRKPSVFAAPSDTKRRLRGTRTLFHFTCLACRHPRAERSWGLHSSTFPPFHSSTSPPFPIPHSPFPHIKTVLLLMKRMKGRRGVQNFVSRAGGRSCRRGLPVAEGRKGVAARGEGRMS